MQVFQIVAVGVMAVVIALVLRASKPELAIQVSLVAAVLITFAVLSNVASVIQYITQIASKYKVDLAYFNVVIKIIGIAYVAELGVRVCNDAGETAIGTKVEMGSKVIMAAMTLPIVTALVETVAGMLG